MPTYEYECDACGGKFELFQAMSADPVKKCELCGKAKARRLIGSGAGIIFKGSGFYETDYKRSGEKKESAAKTDSETKSKSETKSAESKSSETKTSASADAVKSAPSTKSDTATSKGKSSAASPADK